MLVDDDRGVLVPLMAGRRRRAPRRACRPRADLLLLRKEGGQGRSLAAAAGRVDNLEKAAGLGRADGAHVQSALGLVVVARQARHDHSPIGAALIGIPADGQNWRLWRLRRLCSVHGRRDCEAGGSGRRGWAQARNRLARSAGGYARAGRAGRAQSTAVPNLKSAGICGGLVWHLRRVAFSPGCFLPISG